MPRVHPSNHQPRSAPYEEFDTFDSDDEERSNYSEDEHHAIFDCSGYADAREQYCDLFRV